jgi:phage/plasmid primase-like uncharacterized protein
MIDRSAAISKFLLEMATRELTLAPGRQLVADGQWHRCNVANKSDGKGDGSYKLCLDGRVPFGFYRNWTDGKDVDYWSDKPSRPLTEAEREEFDRYVAKARAEAEKMAAEEAIKAAKRAQAIWKEARPASPDHPYLVKKGVKPHGLRAWPHALLVPIYDQNRDLVSLQMIEKSGRKIFLTGGRTQGCFFDIRGSNPDCIVICEGFATAASIFEATGAWVGVAFSANNLVPVATMIRCEISDANSRVWRRQDREEAKSPLEWRFPRNTHFNPKLIIAADDDWKTKDNPGLFHGLDAARAAHALIAIPNFGDDRKDAETDFNDLAGVKDGHGHEYVREDIEAAVEPNQLLEEVLLADPQSAHGEAMLKQLLQVREQDREHYEKLLFKLKAEGVRTGELDRAVKAESKRAAARQAAAHRRADPVEVDVEKLAKSAKAIVASKNVLELFAKDCSRVIAGEESLAKLIYLAATSRLFDESMHVAVKGPSAVGKSKTRKAVLEFFPPESVISFTALSEKALLHFKDDFAHKVLSMGEASTKEETKFQDYLLRELMSEGKLRYLMAMKVGDHIETVTIEKNGPVSFIVTTTRNSLNPENETRMLSLEVDDSASQTRNMLRQVATVEGLNRQPVQADYEPWHDFQRLLETGERRVVIQWAKTLTELMASTKSVRLRRDFKQLLLAIKAHALLHRDHRKRNGRGEIIATIKSDYAAVYELMKDLLASAAEVKARKTAVETVAAINAVFKAEPRRDNVTVRQIAEKLGVDRTATYRRVQAAQAAGYVTNTEKRQGHPGLYQVAEEPSAVSELLPAVEALLGKWNEERADRNARFVTPPKSAATQQQGR